MASRIVHPPVQVGDRFGRLVILSVFSKKHEARKNTRHCSAICDCGKIVPSLFLSNVKRGLTVSCGCFATERRRSTRKIPKEWESTAKAFSAAKIRCEKPGAQSYKHYGGRGIRFMFGSVAELVERIGVKPVGYELDRIDNNRGYEKGNVRWVTREQNTRNTRKSFYWETPFGIFESAREAAKALDLSPGKVCYFCKGGKYLGKIYPPKDGWRCYPKYKQG